MNGLRLSLAAVVAVALMAAGCSSKAAPSSATQVGSVSVTGVAPTLGNTTQLNAVANFAGGSTQNVTNSATWFSSNTAVVTVSAAGVATGVGGGTAVVQATYQGVTGTLSLTVVIALPPPPNINEVTRCDKTVDDASTLSRSLYLPSYPGTALSEVDLGFTSKDVAGTYGVTLNILVNGNTVATPSGSFAITAVKQRGDVAFTVSPPVTIARGSAVRFVAQRTSGAGELSFEGQTDAGCAVLVTADASQTTQIVGPKIPIRILGTP
jgi:hypothetical protein